MNKSKLDKYLQSELEIILKVLKLVDEHFDKYATRQKMITINTGICNIVGDLYETLNLICFYEVFILYGYIDTMLDIPFSKYNPYGFPKGKATPRRKWIKEQIELLTKHLEHGN